MQFFMDRNEDRLDKKILRGFIDGHKRECARSDKLNDYYCGKHDILSREQRGEWSPNNRIVCNFAKYITDTAVGYAFGNPVNLKFENGQEIMDKAFFDADSQGHDSELAKMLSVFGLGYELVYVDEGKVGLAVVDPRNAFVVRDNTVRQKVLFGVVYGAEPGSDGVNVVKVYDEEKIVSYRESGGKLWRESVEEHLLGGVPLIEYWNNDEGMGDFEHVLSLIDAYNTLQSDRINDKERFVDSVLLIQGCQFPDDESAAKMLTNRILELPYDGADARYLTKTMNEAETEILRKAIAEDIHKFSQTPDFSDEHFSGNSTGVAIKYKLLSIENLAKVKERFFVSGLKERIGFFERVLRLGGQGEFGLSSVGFNRVLPINEYEVAQTIAMLHGILPEEELLKRWE